jgi:hypothetical protein
MAIFDKQWWIKTLQLNEITDNEVESNIITGFKLYPFKQGFGRAYKTLNGKASKTLANQINVWINKTFPESHVRVAYESIYATINIINPKSLNESILQESPPINFETDDYENYVNQNRGLIEKAAAEFNFPIQDMLYAFTAGAEVVLSDDIWSKLENSKSYKIKSLDEAIQIALKAGIDPKPYIDFIKDGKELPLPMVLCYSQDKYYLVGGDLILSLYKALGSIPTVLQGTLNMQNRTLHEPLEEDTNSSVKNKHADIVKYFLKFAVKELGLKKLPSGITLSYNTEQAKDTRSFGTFNPENDHIWLYVKDRNTADFLRTLAHELVHRKQAEDGRLEPGDGATGSDIENEANAQAGILLRKFGKEHEDIYETLNEIRINDPAAPYLFDWAKYSGNHRNHTRLREPGDGTGIIEVEKDRNNYILYGFREEGINMVKSIAAYFNKSTEDWLVMGMTRVEITSDQYDKLMGITLDEMKVNNPSNLVIIEVGNGDGLLVEDTYLFTDYFVTPDLKERYEIVDASIEVDEDRDGKEYISINFPEPSFGGGASEADINNSYDYWEANCAIGEKVLTKYSYDYDQDYYKIDLDNVTNADLLNEMKVNNPSIPDISDWTAVQNDNYSYTYLEPDDKLGYIEIDQNLLQGFNEGGREMVKRIADFFQTKQADIGGSIYTMLEPKQLNDLIPENENINEIKVKKPAIYKFAVGDKIATLPSRKRATVIEVDPSIGLNDEEEEKIEFEGEYEPWYLIKLDSGGQKEYWPEDELTHINTNESK